MVGVIDICKLSNEEKTDERFDLGEAARFRGFSPFWYAVYTRHQHEKVTARLLAYKGFEVFLPLYNSAHRWKDRTKKLSLPLFPCYLFLRGGLERQFEILNTPGVYSMVRSGDRTAVIPELEIQAVRRVIETSAKAEPHPFLECGDRVRVRSGPLTGVEGILLRKRDLFRLVLTVDLLHRSIAVEVDVDDVESVRKPGIPTELRKISSIGTEYRLGVA